jgi:hypothetical protein
MAFSVLVFLIEADRAEDSSEALLARTHPLPANKKETQHESD